MSIPNAENPANPSVSALTVYSSPSSYDALYSPFDDRFYTTPAAIPRGTYAPALPNNLLGTREYLTIRFQTTAAFSSFVISLANSSAISNVYIAWSNVNSGAWYSAKTLYNAGGCAATTYPSDGTGLRFPVTLPQGQTISGAGYVYMRVYFTGYVKLGSIQVTYS
jgi:hypothetical protein